LLAGEGVGGPNSDEGTFTVVLYIPGTVCVRYFVEDSVGMVDHMAG
jgi:hypothetical protein